MSIETDKIVVEFMGAEIERFRGLDYVHFPDYIAPLNPTNSAFILRQLDYLTSYDWLLPVAKKLCALESYRDTQPFLALRMCPVTVPIELLYGLVVTCIQFYNLKEGK